MKTNNFSKGIIYAFIFAITAFTQSYAGQWCGDTQPRDSNGDPTGKLKCYADDDSEWVIQMNLFQGNGLSWGPNDCVYYDDSSCGADFTKWDWANPGAWCQLLVEKEGFCNQGYSVSNTEDFNVTFNSRFTSRSTGADDVHRMVIVSWGKTADNCDWTTDNLFELYVHERSYGEEHTDYDSWCTYYGESSNCSGSNYQMYNCDTENLPGNSIRCYRINARNEETTYTTDVDCLWENWRGAGIVDDAFYYFTEVGAEVNGSSSGTFELRNAEMQRVAAGNSSPPPSTDTDDIISTTVPSSVNPGQQVTIQVEYSASTNRDIQVVFQINESPWTRYGNKTTSVSAGSGTIDVTFNIDSNTPIANDAYQFQTFITSTGSGWPGQANLNKDNIDCVQSGGNNNGGTYYYVKNKATNKYLRPDHDGETAWLRVQAKDNSDIYKWKKVSSSNGYFYLQNKQTGMYFRPINGNDGARIEQRPTNFSGNWTQWKEVAVSDGSVHLENRESGKFIRPTNNGSDTNLELRPNTWTGNWTRWYFESAGSRKGIEETQEILTSAIKAYQNSEHTLSVSGMDFSDVRLFDLNGQLKWQSNSQNNSYNIDIAGFESGIYILRTVNIEGIADVKKLVLR